jgi:hypothetical protein
MLRSRRMRWVGNIARLGEMRNVYKIFVGKPEGKRLLGRRSADGRIISKRILAKWCWRMWTGFICLRIGTSGGFL